MGVNPPSTKMSRQATARFASSNDIYPVMTRATPAHQGDREREDATRVRAVVTSSTERTVRQVNGCRWSSRWARWARTNTSQRYIRRSRA